MTILLKQIITPDPAPFRRNYAYLGDPRANRPAGMPFDSACQEQERWYEHEYADRKDIEVNLEQLTLVQDYHLQNANPLMLRTPSGPMEFRATGIRNLCSLIGVPFDFVRELPSEYAVRDINYMLRRAGSKQIKLRTAIGGTNIRGCRERNVRAIVSPRYAEHDLPHLLETVGDALDRAGIAKETSVMEAHIGKTTRLWLTLSPQMRGADGYPVTPGIKLRNGESGNSAIGIDPGFLRTICTNGLIHHDAAKGIRAKHAGSTDELAERISYNLPRLFDEAHRITNAANLAGSNRVGLASAESVLQSTMLNKKQQSYVMRVACAEAQWRKLAADAEIAWHDESMRYRKESLEPVSASVYEELKEANSRACDIIAADIMNGMTQLAQEFAPHMRQRAEREAHKTLYALQSDNNAHDSITLDLSDDDLYRRNAAFHSAALNTAN
tara:strand:- start:1274 stop:2596 length:1323 start_codon:yes stop_codon:yes gene_type:complete